MDLEKDLKLELTVLRLTQKQLARLTHPERVRVLRYLLSREDDGPAKAAPATSPMGPGGGQ